MFAKILLCAGVLLLSTAVDHKPKTKPQSGPVQKRHVEHEIRPEAKLIARLVAKLVSQQRTKQLDLLPIEENIVKYTNAERAKHGLPALQIDRELMKSARQHASWMANNRSLVHTRRPVAGHIVAENIAMGQPRSRSAVRDWMNSSGHRANILNRGHRRIGAAAYRTQNGTIYWCQQFRR